jgi:thiamine-phosphate pyrophosphorylase
VTARAALPRVHAVTDERIARRDDLDQVAQALVAAGGDAIALHARGRALTGREHFDLARRLPPPGRRFVNDRLDIALAVGAAGVQLGTTSLSVAAARALGPTWWIGRSVHDLAGAHAALAEAADYLVVGPVFATATHPGRKPLGVQAFAHIVQIGLPAIAIGGVTPARAVELRGVGAYGVAAISALWDAREPGHAVRELLEVFT